MAEPQQPDRETQIQDALERGDLLTSINLKQQRYREHLAQVAAERNKNK